jgi:hypothetical protein
MQIKTLIFKIDENVECAENELKNVNENVQIDLANEKIESSTESNSVSAEIDYNPVLLLQSRSIPGIY